MRELIRHILKENRIQQELKQVIKNSNIFDAADMVGGVENLKRIFKGDPEFSSLFDKLTGTVTFYYIEYLEFPLEYEIINRRSNVHNTNHWPEINVLYDENKLTPEENELFKEMIKYLVDEAQHSGFESKFKDGRLFNTNYLTVKEINGQDINSIDYGYDFSNEDFDVKNIHNKLYGESESLNESDNREIDKNLRAINVLLSLVSWDGLCDIWVKYNPDDKEYEIRSKTVSSDDLFTSIDEIEKELNSLEDSIRSMGIRVYIYTPWYVDNCDDEVKFMNESLNESEKDTKKLFKITKMIMEDMILPEYNHIICSYEITLNEVFNIPEVTVLFIGGYGTKLWPMTQGIRQMYLNVLEDISKEIANYTGVVIGVRGEQTPKCDDKENIYLRESESEDKDYSPAGKEITPNQIVVHKSNPMFRDKIMENGLKVKAGECYKVYVGYGVKCKPAIFATNSTNKRAWFDSTYDDDIWFIDTTMIPDVKWFKDRHFESRSKHIVTFQDIPKEAITLKYEGTGSNEDVLNSWPEDSPNRLQESIRRILRENSLKNDLMESEEKQPKYLNILKDLVKPFKDEDCVCNVEVYYDTEDDMYTVTLEVGMKELRGKSNNSFVRAEYVRSLRRDIKTTVKDYLPIQNIYISSIATPGCGSERWWDNINESSIKERSLVKLIEKDGLYNFIEMSGLDFNQVRSLLKNIDNSKEILKQYIREFVLEHDGTSGENHGSLFALRLPLSNTKYVNDILVQDSEQIAVEIIEYYIDEYGHREDNDQYLTSINNLTDEELLSILSWMMETVEGGYWF
jgi:hypothetical protein